eukprot:2134229-Amphidinium_carterae.1
MSCIDDASIARQHAFSPLSRLHLRLVGIRGKPRNKFDFCGGMYAAGLGNYSHLLPLSPPT